MTHEYLHRLQVVAKAAHKIERYVDDTSFQEFARDSMCRDAVLHNLHIINASVTSLPEAVRAQYLPVQGWAFAPGLGEHDEPTVDWAHVWDTVQQQLPPLNRSIKAALRQESFRLVCP